MTATLTAPASALTGAGGGGRVLHAGPPGSPYSFCGKRRRDELAALGGTTERCRKCEEAVAACSNPMRR